jgi:hypothetical protein
LCSTATLCPEGAELLPNPVLLPQAVISIEMNVVFLVGSESKVMGEVGIKDCDEGIYCKNLYKCHNVPLVQLKILIRKIKHHQRRAVIPVYIH